MTDWLITFHAEQPTLVDGEPWAFWVPPSRDRATGAVRRRGDGRPYTPAMSDGDVAYIYVSSTARIVAELIIEGVHWDENDELFIVDSTVGVLSFDGPGLADVGIAKAVQGGRQRISAVQRDTAAEALRATSGLMRRMEAAAAQTVARWHVPAR